ncbi:AraC family transcriptional regulator [Leucobacter rhizosphaerae]|uniref:AraC family transcriptional regulator n=1 Tax=Leucobacter rhizosphaerae TaxID=2932245 RepID=A0ABY4FUQ3_9MICO|nr:AraC family transcriptional regulator [Leucobacter rhizosphaerae]UOQ60036.1 AraC family transcriptional regulator [Leucobacter rhizosphaerae]
MAAPLLSGFPVARAASAGRLRDAVDGVTGYDHAVLAGSGLQGATPPGAPPGSPRGTVNGARFDVLSLVYVAYATPVRVVAPATRGQVVLVVPLGPMDVTVDGRHTRMTTPFVLSASADTVMVPDPAAGALVGAVDASALTALLQESFGADREFAVDLAQARPIPVTAGPALRRVWSTFAADPDGDPSPLVDSLVVGLSMWTTYRDSELTPWSAPPAYLAEAVRHLRRTLSEPVSLASLGEVVGIGSRQLQLAFQAHLGRTAQEYLRDARLDRAWVLLRDAGGGAGSPRSVSEVAAEVGIPHTGRFAQYFVERFGVLPSELRA